MIEGQAVIKVQQDAQFRVVGTFEALSISGNLPYSRADKAFGYAQFSRPAKLLTVAKSRFREMITEQEDLLNTQDDLNRILQSIDIGITNDLLAMDIPARGRYWQMSLLALFLSHINLN